MTGSIGAGKSTVAALLESLGAAVVDSDRLAHEELADPEVATILKSWWGEGVERPDGGVDREAVASIVFNDAAQLARLEELLYPRIHSRRKALCSRHQQDNAAAAIVIEAPKLYEAGVDGECDVVLFVDAERALRVERVRQVRGWTEEELSRRENLQNSVDKKRRKADYVIENNSSIDALSSTVEKVFAKVLASCSQVRI